MKFLISFGSLIIKKFDAKNVCIFMYYIHMYIYIFQIHRTCIYFYLAYFLHAYIYIFHQIYLFYIDLCDAFIKCYKKIISLIVNI